MLDEQDHKSIGTTVENAVLKGMEQHRLNVHVPTDKAVKEDFEKVHGRINRLMVKLAVVTGGCVVIGVLIKFLI